MGFSVPPPASYNPAVDRGRPERHDRPRPRPRRFWLPPRIPGSGRRVGGRCGIGPRPPPGVTRVSVGLPFIGPDGQKSTCHAKYLSKYWTELDRIFSIGRIMYADYKTEITFAVVEETLLW